MINDQRRMCGPMVHTNAGDVEAFWIERGKQLAARGRGFLRDGDYTPDLLHTRRTVTAYVNQGRWVADCPECNGGIACWPEHDHGACLDCGRVYKVTFPTAASIAKAEKALSRRPPANRNWRPDKDEQAGVLVEQNARRGL